MTKGWIEGMFYKMGGNGEAVVFLHGDTLDHRQWNKQIDFFIENNQVITYDLRGYGQSQVPVKSFSHVADLKMLLEKLNIKKAHLIGSSYGGEQAINFVLTYPGMVNSLVLADTSLSGYPCSVDWEVSAKVDGLEKAKERWLNHEVFAQIRDNPEIYKEIKKMIEGYSGNFWFKPNLHQILEPPAFNRLSEINMPSLIIVGSKDLTYFKDIALYLHSKITGSNYEIIVNSSHLPNMEMPDIFNKLVSNWLEKQKG